jgi:tRNA A-37 threonylcarbamoyl transferase component Bud32
MSLQDSNNKHLSHKKDEYYHRYKRARGQKPVSIFGNKQNLYAQNDSQSKEAQAKRDRCSQRFRSESYTRSFGNISHILKESLN